MVSDSQTASDDAAAVEFGHQFKFHEVFFREVELINDRRALERRGRIELEIEDPENVSGEKVLAPVQGANVVGLALSGGGIRSAAFCVGALQALHVTKVLDRADYLSTVSGGGYTGCCLTAALDYAHGQGWTQQTFPFSSLMEEDETPALQHIRDYSNYLFPRGEHALLSNAAVYARGLVVNAVLVAPFLLGASALTLLYYGLRGNQPEFITRFLSIANPFQLSHFFLTADLALIIFAVGIGWGIVQSLRLRQAAAEVPSMPTRFVGWLLVVLLIALFCEVQPFVIDAMLKQQSGSLSTLLSNWINIISAISASLAAVIAFLASKLGEFVKSAAESAGWTAKFKGLVAKAAIYFAGLIVPLVLWVVYLDVTYWGICIDDPNCSCSPPAWLAGIAYFVFAKLPQPALALYFAVSIVCVILAPWMRPNANSLHPLYRDRLGKAFLFEPSARLDKDKELKALRPRLSAISGLAGPYHLINAALNIQDSTTANRRGRNADFFMFSPQFVGSKATDYVATTDVENVAVDLDLATAMAVSGAAVSSNMGAQSVKPLTATLALLNIRLGYWLRNPARLEYADPKRSQGWRGAIRRLLLRRNLLANYYFLAELLGLLTEKRKSIYLTDGGHIENLGIYELLKRRCRVIIAVDAEADRQMAFGSFNTLERYALIDLGVRIDLPWQQITDESLATGAAIDDTGNAPKHQGPHCAIGEISYPGNRKGILVYIKASLTGDENDYVFDYKKRHDDFPHETTLDQMFTEQQFEAYRALGFHAAFRLFDRSDKFAHLDPEENPEVQRQLAILDALFPRVAAGGPPGQKQAFAEWLPGGEADAAPRQAS